MGRRRSGQSDRPELDERIIEIKRVSKVVKGGRRFAFRATVVVGDNRGNVGFGTGKSRAVPDAIRKAIEKARKSMIQVPMVGTTVPHEVVGRLGAAKVLLKPASPGTGVIAGGSVRAVIEAAGYKDILSKSLGSNNVLNVIQATMEGLGQLKHLPKEAEERELEVADVTPFWAQQG